MEATYHAITTHKCYGIGSTNQSTVSRRISTNESAPAWLYLHHWTHPVKRSHISLCQELKTLNMILLATNQIRVTIGLLVNSI